MTDFSSFPREVVELILERIIPKNPFIDTLSLADLSKLWRSIVGVSKEWRSIAVDKLTHLLPRVIILTNQDEELRGKWCLGSNNGWLLLVEKSSGQISLLNPFFKEQTLPLPCRPSYLRTMNFTLKINSTSDYQVAIGRKFTCKAGEWKWTVLDAFLPNGYLKTVTYYNEKLCVLSTFQERVYLSIKGEYNDKTYECSVKFLKVDDATYLVETPQKELLMVRKYVRKRTVDFVVFKWDGRGIDENSLDDESEAGDNVLVNKVLVWVEVHHLGDNVLFLGMNSFCLPARDVPGCTSNSIYFTDYEHTDGRSGTAVFNMDNQIITPLFQDHHPKLASSLWFTPNLTSWKNHQTI